MVHQGSNVPKVLPIFQVELTDVDPSEVDSINDVKSMGSFLGSAFSF